jgi:hypothetical protein
MVVVPVVVSFPTLNFPWDIDRSILCQNYSTTSKQHT